MVWLYWILGWIVCGITAAGLINADFKRSIPYASIDKRKHDLNIAIWMGMLGGPAVLFLALLVGAYLSGWSLTYKDKLPPNRNSLGKCPVCFFSGYTNFPLYCKHPNCPNKERKLY